MARYALFILGKQDVIMRQTGMKQWQASILLASENMSDAIRRPTKYDYDRYIWLVQLGKDNNWDDRKIKEKCPFRVAEPGMTFTLLRAQRDLLKIGQLLGRDTDQIEKDIAILEGGAQSLWNDDISSYDSRNTKTGNWSKTISNASFLCWYAGIQSEPMRETLKRIMQDVEYGIPSLDPRDPKFDGQRYWRGPVWGVVNLLIGMGMEEFDLIEGTELRQNTAKLIRSHGFAEYFDPRDGSPAGGKSFTWTAAVWLSWASAIESAS